MLKLLFADEKFIISNRENNSQKAVNKLKRTITEHGLKMSVEKTKLMEFKEGDPVRSKTVVDNKITEQLNSFDYLENLISHEK